jgi:hypothetical protein
MYIIGLLQIAMFFPQVGPRWRQRRCDALDASGISV